MNSQDSFDTSFGDEDGPFLLSIIREIISSYLNTGKRTIPSSLISDPRFNQKMGCFVTLKRNDPDRSLRGCVGFAEPVYELKKALTHAGIAAATEDPRFSPIKAAELGTLLLEISLLTKPIEISVKDLRDLPKKIVVGKDGLIMHWSFGSGLLLPQVAMEYNWSAEDFLCNLSQKAGAPPDQWLVPGTMIYRFRAQVFQEDSPGGPVSME